MSTFGYTSIGGTASNNSSPVACKFTAPGTNGSISKLTVYCGRSSAGTNALGVAIYADNSGAPTGALLAQDSGTGTVNQAAGWVDVNISYNFASGQVLWLTLWGGDDADFQYYYDAGDVSQEYVGFSGTFETWVNPGDAFFPVDRVVSIYATYSTGGGNTLWAQSLM